MRLIVVAAALAALSLPAVAQDSLYDQYVEARRVFLGDSQDNSDYIANYRKVLFDGIEGKWVLISVLQPESGDSDIVAKSCEKIFVRIVQKNAHTLDFIQNEGLDTEVHTLFSNRGGAAFGQYVDTAALLHRLGIGEDDDMRTSGTMNMLNNANGFATIRRPSPDILVVEPNLSVPTIYGRCPE